MNIAGRALLPAVLLALAAPADADPRWWWDDLRLTNTAGDSVTPHLRTPGYATGGAGGQAVFLTWSERDPVERDLDVMLTASFDGGCTFCEPTQLTFTTDDEERPRVAVLVLPEGTWSIAVIYATPASGEVTIAWDSTNVSYRVPPDELCRQMTALGPLVAAADQYVRFAGGADAYGQWPDISAAGTFDFGHFHATWSETTFIGPVIQHARDLSARGGAGWRLDPVKTIATLGPIDVNVERPRIAADLATDPDPVSGVDTRDRSGVSVAWVRHREAGPTVLTEIMGLRSVDSGSTFSPTGARADAPGEALSDSFAALPDADVRPALDSAFSSFSTTQPAWVMAAWSAQVGRGLPGVGADRRFVERPAIPLPDWQVPGDDDLGSCSALGDGAPSVALQYQFAPQPSPAWLAWQDSRSSVREIVSRAGLLDAAAAAPFDPLAYPIAPVRPLDSAVSSDVQLSHCALDEATFLCPTTRAAGEAQDVSLDANEFGVFAAWSDTRDGNAEIYFKRVDTSVSANPPDLAADCDADGTAHVDVTFPLLPSCPTPFAGERMRRYLIYWRDDPSGGYVNAAAPMIVDHASEPGPTATRRILGLTPGVAWRVIVVPEDQARNVSPADFDPAVAPAFAPFNEREILTPSPCAIAEPCLWRADLTSLRPHVPARGAIYLVPPSAEDIHLQGASYDCPVASGDLEPDASALDNRVPLSLYQVNRPFGTLRLAKSARTIRFSW